MTDDRAALRAFAVIAGYGVTREQRADLGGKIVLVGHSSTPYTVGVVLPGPRGWFWSTPSATYARDFRTVDAALDDLLRHLLKMTAAQR